MKVRPAVSVDIKKIVEFQLSMAKESESTDLNEKLLLRGVTAVLNDSQKARYFVAEENKKLIGCFMVTAEWSDWRAGYFIWLQSVYVLPEFRKKGVFTDMYEYLKTIIEENVDYCGIRLYVDDDNDIAKKSYLKLGMADSSYTMMEWSKNK